MVRDASITSHGPDQLGHSKEGIAKRSKLSDEKNDKEECSQWGVSSGANKKDGDSTSRCLALQFLQILDWKKDGNRHNKGLNNTTSYGNHQADRTTGTGIASTFSNLCAIFVSNLYMRKKMSYYCHDCVALEMRYLPNTSLLEAYRARMWCLDSCSPWYFGTR